MIDVERILDGLNHKRRDTHRLSRIMFGALGEVEAALIGAPPKFQRRSEEIVTLLRSPADELRRLA